MSEAILLLEGNYHLGDNPGVFQTATFIGIKLALPLTKTWIDETQETVHFLFETSDIETWGANWHGHSVTINGTEIGRLTDSNDKAGKFETFDLSISRQDLLNLLGASDQFVLEVELERQASMPGFSDDFTLRRISTKNLAVKVG